MQPGNMPLSLYQGDSYHWQFKLWMDVARTIPLDLTNVTPVAEIRDRQAGNLITTIDCVVTLPNIIDATLSAANSSILPSTAAWDLTLFYQNGDVTTSLAGIVTTTSDVSQASGASAASVPPSRARRR